MNIKAENMRSGRRLLWVIYAFGALLIAWRATEPLRRLPFIPGRGAFLALTLEPLLFLLIGGGSLVALALWVRRALRAPDLSLLGKCHGPLVLLCAGVLAFAVPWEDYYWRWHWNRHKAQYEEAAALIAGGGLPRLGQTGMLSLVRGIAVALPARLAGLTLDGRAFLYANRADSLGVLFPASAWWTDNWEGYVFMREPAERPAYFGGHYFIIKRLGQHWWFVGST